MISTIQKWGNSLALRIPSAIARQMQVEQGDAIELTCESGTLTIRSARAKYQLDDLVGGIHAGNRHEEVDWGTSVGREA